MSSSLTWFYSPSYSYKSYILLQSSLHLLTSKQKMYFQLKKPCCCTRFCKHFIAVAELSYDTKKWKEKWLNEACAFYTKHKDKFTSPKHKLLALLVKANTAYEVKAYWEVSVTTLDTCNIPAAVWPQYC